MWGKSRCGTGEVGWGCGMLLHVLIHSGTPALALKIIRGVEKRLICTYTVVCIYSGVIIKTLSLSEQSLSAEAPGILSTELMIFYLWLNGVRWDCTCSLQKFI